MSHDASKPDSTALIQSVAEGLVATYRDDARGHHLDRRFLPSREGILRTLRRLLGLMYPGYDGTRLQLEGLGPHVEHALAALKVELAHEIEMCLCCERERQQTDRGLTSTDVAPCRPFAEHLTAEFLGRLPAVRRQLIDDVQAAYDGDPAAADLDEIVLAYPGLLAISVYRLAHPLHRLGVPLMPRIMTEWAHTQTGADIHPGADIGTSFFLDHATGVVIGETTKIGVGVKLYQGVTLGALSHPKDSSGRVIRGTKRHPTVEDGVTVYANATVLGGETVLGAGSVIGGSAFITGSVPAGARVAMRPPELRVRASMPSDAPDSDPSSSDG